MLPFVAVEKKLDAAVVAAAVAVVFVSVADLFDAVVAAVVLVASLVVAVVVAAADLLAAVVAAVVVDVAAVVLVAALVAAVFVDVAAVVVIIGDVLHFRRDKRRVKAGFSLWRVFQ